MRTRRALQGTNDDTVGVDETIGESFDPYYGVSREDFGLTPKHLPFKFFLTGYNSRTASSYLPGAFPGANRAYSA